MILLLTIVWAKPICYFFKEKLLAQSVHIKARHFTIVNEIEMSDD
jgi:hypothetical protein